MSVADSFGLMDSSTCGATQLSAGMSGANNFFLYGELEAKIIFIIKKMLMQLFKALRMLCDGLYSSSSYVTRQSATSTLDPQLLADHDSELIGSVPAEAMTRMKNTVVSMDPMVAVNLQFSCGSYGLARVTGRIQHTVGLRCQRCLDATQISLDQAYRGPSQARIRASLANC